LAELVTSDDFRAALKSLGVSQLELAERLGVDPSTVNRWATGKVALPQHVRYVIELLSRAEAERWLSMPR
jgi:transcriptional regulator with XRE-family HTH domain